MNVRRPLFAAAFSASVVWAVCAAPAWALHFQFDCTYDGGFFTSPAVNPQAAAARAALDYAARSFEMYTDHLTQIGSADSGATWQRGFFRPDVFQPVWVDGGVVPADTLVIYVGGYDLRPYGSTLLAAGAPGGSRIADGAGGWVNTVLDRGQAGAALSPPIDFGPWGGSITFNSTENWSYDLHHPPADGLASDFLSTVLHEMCHVLGVGFADSGWFTHVSEDPAEFTGPAAVKAFGGPVPLSANLGHWAPGTMSTVAGVAQEAELDPDLATGTRKCLTVLDRAALADIGWQMPLAGDADHNGSVDGTDYLAIKQSFGTYGTWADGDFDEDGIVGPKDLAALEANFGRQADDGPAAAALAEAQLPEPASLSFVAAGAAWLLTRRARRLRAPAA